MYGLATQGTIASPRKRMARNCRLPNARRTSDLPQAAAAEEALRQEDQHQHDDDVGRDVLQVGADVAAGERLDEADEEAAHHRTRDAGEAAEHGGGEGLDEEHEADV